MDHKKKRKSSSGMLKRSKSNASIVEKSSSSSRRARRIEKLNMSSAGVLFCGDKSESRSNPISPLLSSPDSPDSPLGGIPYEVFYDDEQDSIFYGTMEGGRDACIPRPFVSEIEPGGTLVLADTEPLTSKRHSLPCCPNCDTQYKKTGKLPKSISMCSASERLKSSKEKVKKVKKSKKSKDNSVENRYFSSPPQSVDHEVFNDHHDHNYSRANGNLYDFQGHHNELYYNGHGSVHFSEDTKINGDHSPHYNYTPHPLYTDSYANGIDSHASLYTGNNFMYTDHDRLHINERQKVIPKAKTKVKLRSDNWEWYSTQHPGGSSSETVSTCSDSSGRGRKLRGADEGKSAPGTTTPDADKKVTKKKKSKTKSPSLIKEDVIPERDTGT